MKIWKYSGMFLTGTGILHVIAALILEKQGLAEIIRNGPINSVGDDCVRGLAFWFLVCGIIVILFGHTLHLYIKQVQKPAPLFFGWFLLIFAVAGCVIVPVSGFWLFLPQALIVIVANKKTTK